ncbi:MAG: LarC family nickel insertion protein [Gammaproteobacteria bacterium]
MHLHLDAVGGIAGDMFVAALLDLAPELAEGACAATRAAGLDPAVSVALVPHDDGVLTGRRFVVQGPGADTQRRRAQHRGEGGHAHAPTDNPRHARSHASRVAHAHDHAYAHEHAHEHEHDHAGERDHDHATPSAGAHAHVRWAELRAQLAASPLAVPVRERVIDIFAGLADAEARVHGRSVEDVSFHEVGAWDSIADIVAAAWLIDAVGATSWSVGPLPLGSGRVRTAHGLLPVPAPATVLLLQGLPCFDDGQPGERITPTGAAILRHLAPRAGLGHAPRVLARAGHGFGARRLSGLSNVLRVLAFDEAVPATGIEVDQVTTLAFEVDDQTPEDLALGLARLRAEPGVLDVVQGSVTGKQGRQAAAVHVIAAPAADEAVAAACFRETTTLGVRMAQVERRILSRDAYTAADGTRVKRARRPGGVTAKAELADLARADGHAARERQRRHAEQAALESDDSGTERRG